MDPKQQSSPCSVQRAENTTTGEVLVTGTTVTPIKSFPSRNAVHKAAFVAADLTWSGFKAQLFVLGWNREGKELWDSMLVIFSPV